MADPLDDTYGRMLEELLAAGETVTADCGCGVRSWTRIGADGALILTVCTHRGRTESAIVTMTGPDGRPVDRVYLGDWDMDAPAPIPLPDDPDGAAERIRIVLRVVLASHALRAAATPPSNK